MYLSSLLGVSFYFEANARKRILLSQRLVWRPVKDDPQIEVSFSVEEWHNLHQLYQFMS